MEDFNTADILENIVKSTNVDKISLASLVQSMEGAGFGILLFLFSLTLFIPLPPPSSTICSLPIMFISFQMVMGKENIWLPKTVGNLEIKRKSLAKLISISSVYLRKMEFVLKPRLRAVTSVVGERILGAFCLFLSCLIFIPIPFTNLIPAVAVLMISIGIMSKDGLLVLMGGAIGFVGFVLTISVLILGTEILFGLFA